MPSGRSTRLEAVHRYNEFYRRYFSLFPHFGRHHCLPGQVNASTDAARQSLSRTCMGTLSGVFMMPIVFAEEAPPSPGASLTVETEKKALTTLEAFERRRPKLVVTDLEVREYLAKESGWDRLRDMYSITDRGDLHPNLSLCTQSATMSGFGIFFVMSILGARAAKLSHIERSKQTVYATKFKAMRAHNDAVLVGGLKTGVLYGFKAGFFALVMMVTSQTVAAYRNKTSVWEYVIAGALTGAIWRMNMGLKGMIGSATITGALGAVAGVGITLTLSAGNCTQQRRHYWEIDDRIRRKKETELLQNLPVHASKAHQQTELS